MNDPLDIIWAAFDTVDPVFTAETVQAWPTKVLEQLTTLKLLVPAASASHVVCPNCEQRHVEEVTQGPGPGGTTRFFISCPEAMKVEIDPSLLCQWQPDFKMLARRAKELLNIKGRATEHVPNRLWRLGTLTWKQRPREVFIARGLIWPDAAVVAAGFTATSRPIVFVGSSLPPDRNWPALPPAVVQLSAVISLDAGRLELERLLLQRLIDEADEAARQRRQVEDRELQQRVRATADRHLAEGGTDKLVEAVARSTSTTDEGVAELSKRGVTMDRATFARKKKQLIDGGQIQRTASSPSLLRHRPSQPRDRKGRLLPGAQPEDEE